MPNKKQQKILATIFCFLSDTTLVAWIYFIFTNYGRYIGAVSETIDSPDFQIQLYKIILQSLTFMLLLFISAQLIVYILAWRGFRSAYFYLKFFSVFGFVFSLYICITISLYALLPLFIYVGGYYIFAKLYQEASAELQKLPQSPTPQSKIE